MARGRKTGGRRPGSSNKTTVAVKAALVAAFDELGGVASLVEWGKENRGEFYKLWARLLPTEIKNADDNPFKMEIAVRVVDEPAES